MRIITHSSLEINRNCCREKNMKHREMSPYGSYMLRPQILLMKEENRQTWLGGDGSGRVGEGAAETKQICGGGSQKAAAAEGWRGGSLGAGRCVAGPP